MNWRLLFNSAWVSGLATVWGASAGAAVALCAIALLPRARGFLIAGAAASLAMPPFLTVNCWLDLLGWTGRWRAVIPWDIYSFSGTVWILGLLYWPVTFFLLLGAWQRLESDWLEVEPALRGAALIRHLLAPAGREALLEAAALTFALNFNNFAVPAILQVKVFPAELWIGFSTMLNYRAALILSWPMIVIPGIVLWLLRTRREIQWPRWKGSASGGWARPLGPSWTGIASASAVLMVGLSLALPWWNLLGARRTWTELQPAWAASRAAAAATVATSGSAAALCAILAVAAWRWRAAALSWLLFLMPGVLTGIALVWALNRDWTALFYQSLGVVILAFVLRYFALAWQAVAGAFRGADSAFVDWIRLQGDGRWRRLKYIYAPQFGATILAAAYLVYLFCLWDVEAQILVTPPGGETLSLRIFNLLHYGHNAQVNALCVLTSALALAPLAAGAGVWRAVRTARRLGRSAGGAARAAGLIITAVSAAIWMGCGAARPQSDTFALSSRLFRAVKIIGQRGAGPGQFNKPRSLALDAQDNLYVVDLTGRVQKFSPGGKFLAFWQMPETDKGKPKGMGRDGFGNIIVVEPHYARVNHLSPAGQWVKHWGTFGTNNGQLCFPRSVAIDARGNLYLTEYGLAERVQVFSPLGERWLRSFGQPGDGPGQFDRAEGIALDSRGDIYVADSCNHRIQVFTNGGKFLRQYGHAGSGPGEFSYPHDIQIDRQGRQYICEFGNSRIQIFDARDHLIEILGQAGAGPEDFNNPWAIALDSKGNLYVADGGNNRVEKYLARGGS